MIDQAAQETGLKPELLHAVIRAESAYDPAALSPAGAGGLMQLMPGTADRYGVRDRFDPAQNLRGGARYLRDLLQMFDRNLQLALAGYNAGENAVIQYDRTIPPYAETQQYVKRVLQYYVEEHQRTGTAASLLVRR
jgi:soluble lytic murein transglycosylase-like protein